MPLVTPADQNHGAPAARPPLPAAVGEAPVAHASPVPPAGSVSWSDPSGAGRWWSRLRGWFSPVSTPTSAARPLPARDLKQLVYRSYGTGLMSMEGLESLLITTRMKNRAAGITGLLIHHKTQYLQCLEGPVATVDALFEVISADPRHDRVVVLRDCLVDRRSFAGWNMACTRVSDSAWLQMSTAAWESQLSGTDAASPGFAFMRDVWKAPNEDTHREALLSAG